MRKESIKIADGLHTIGPVHSSSSVLKISRKSGHFTAVKLLPSMVSADSSYYRHFEEEVEKLRIIQEERSAGIPKVLSHGLTQTGSFPYLETEWIEGEDLCDGLKTSGPFTLTETLRVAGALSRTLAHCHNHGLLHGNIKSSSVRYDAHAEKYILTGFGFSALSDEERRISIAEPDSVGYTAPEQNTGSLLPQTDVYRFGMILFELLTGRLDTTKDLLALRKENLPSGWSEEKINAELQLPEWLTTTVTRCTNLSPDLRFGNALELYDFLLMQHRAVSPQDKALAAAMVQPSGVRKRPVTIEETRFKHQVESAKSTIPATAPKIKVLSKPEIKKEVPSAASLGADVRNEWVKREKQWKEKRRELTSKGKAWTNKGKQWMQKGNSAKGAALKALRRIPVKTAGTVMLGFLACTLVIYALMSAKGKGEGVRQQSKSTPVRNVPSASTPITINEPTGTSINAAAQNEPDGKNSDADGGATFAEPAKTSEPVVVRMQEAPKGGADVTRKQSSVNNVQAVAKTPASDRRRGSFTQDNGKNLGQYKLKSSRAYFHNEPDESTRRKGFIVHWNNAILHALEDKDDFIYIVFTNDEGIVSKGWIRKRDLVKADDEVVSGRVNNE